LPTLTKPENIVKDILEEMGFAVKFFSDKSDKDSQVIYMQVPFMSYSIDFASLENKIAIEVDGEYWHGSSTASMTAAQLKRKLNDSNKDDELQKDGWTVFRIPASSLNHERMRSRLVQYINTLFMKE
jgi:very-short-patch-repair endonuclease